MAERGAIEFEPTVEFPDNGFDAARIYLGLLAYPERGAGQPGDVGSGFAEALWKYYIWQRRRARGLKDVRRLFNDPDFAPPTLREFRGKIERGRKRIERRFAAYDIVGNQMINGILNTGFRAADAKASGRIADPYLGKEGDKIRPFKPEIIKLATPSKHEIIRRNVERYSRRLGLNETGDPSSQKQKIRDLVGRGYYQSRSVLHLAHGLNTVVPKAEKEFQFFSKADWLLVFLWNSEAWIWEALRAAVAWRATSDHNYYADLRADQMVELILPENYAG